MVRFWYSVLFQEFRYVKLNHAIVVQAWPCYRVKLQPLTDKWGVTTYLIRVERVNPGLKSITSYRIGSIRVKRVKSGLEFIASGLYALSSQYSSSFMYTSDSTHQTSAIMATTFGTSFMTYIQFTRFLNQYTSTFRSDFESIHPSNWNFESVALPALQVQLGLIIVESPFLDSYVFRLESQQVMGPGFWANHFPPFLPQISSSVICILLNSSPYATAIILSGHFLNTRTS